MKVLVTGHKGYIGGHLFDALTELGYETTGIDLKEGHDIAHCLPNLNFDYVFHLAGFPRVEYSVHNPSYTLRQNVLVTSTLLEWAKAHAVKRFIFSSSSSVVGDGDGPRSPYGMHKLMSEMECELYSKLYDLDTVCLRYFNVYSEDQEYGGSYSTAICAWLHMMKLNKPLRIDGDGNQSRDLIHVSDVVSANLFCMQHDAPFEGKHFDVGSGETISFNQIKELINDSCNVSWVSAPERAGDVKHTEANISELKDLGWSPKISIREGLRRCFNKGEKNERS